MVPYQIFFEKAFFCSHRSMTNGLLRSGQKLPGHSNPGSFFIMQMEESGAIGVQAVSLLEASGRVWWGNVFLLHIKGHNEEWRTFLLYRLQFIQSNNMPRHFQHNNVTHSRPVSSPNGSRNIAASFHCFCSLHRPQAFLWWGVKRWLQ